jgi:hypothetical protein
VQWSGYNLKLEFKNDDEVEPFFRAAASAKRSEASLIERRTCGDLLTRRMTRDRLNVGNQRRTPFQSAQAKRYNRIVKIVQRHDPLSDQSDSARFPIPNTWDMLAMSGTRLSHLRYIPLHSWGWKSIFTTCSARFGPNWDSEPPRLFS